MSETCGIRLLRLIDARFLEICRRETGNTDRMCLYGTGEYWTGFERSAYFLSRLFPGAETFVVSNPGSPFPIVGASVSDREFRGRMSGRPALAVGDDYMEYSVPPAISPDFTRWLKKIVNSQ